MTIRVLLADHAPAIRAGLRAILEAAHDVEVVGEADNGIDALDQTRTLTPDVVVVAVVMPKLDGVRATAHMQELEHAPGVVALSAAPEHTDLGTMLAAGARGCVTRPECDAELLTAVRAVAAGQAHLSPEAMRHVVQVCLDAPPEERPPEEQELTTREELILRFVADAYPPDVIASKLGIKLETVEKYKAKVMEKLGAKSSADLVLYAFQQGWLRDRR
jgi:DNA-binding NarL/FixJ family response regulator